MRNTSPAKENPTAQANNWLTITDEEFHQLRNFIHESTGIALSEHKRMLVCSRLAKRLRHYGLTRYTDYYKLLTQEDPEGHELLEMINAITTNKTEFFRERHHFQFLTEHVFPAIKQAASRGDSRRIRIWSAGTSTGEEAHSLAMITLESFPSGCGWDIKILATDIDTNVINHAKRGIYTSEQASRIDESLLHRYFLKGNGEFEGYVCARPELKALLRFRHLNLLEQPWPMRGPFDVILFRNVIIYFDKPTQHMLIACMAQMLKHGGYLMLGHSESIHGISEGFNCIGHSTYQRQFDQ